jgi:CHASE3 domain sensor protein
MMPIFAKVLLGFAVLLGVVILYVVVNRTRKDRRRRARWLAGEDR